MIEPTMPIWSISEVCWKPQIAVDFVIIRIINITDFLEASNLDIFFVVICQI